MMGAIRQVERELRAERRRGGPGFGQSTGADRRASPHGYRETGERPDSLPELGPDCGGDL